MCVMCLDCDVNVGKICECVVCGVVLVDVLCIGVVVNVYIVL